jgi:glucosyl-dolichyl phosphate glucuronosyltransferase
MPGAIRHAPAADVTVITATYSMERWALSIEAVESVLRQTILPKEIILPVDHNPELYERLRHYWGARCTESGPAITVVESKYEGHLGASATTAAELATTEYLAFLDDDASADSEWLERLLAALQRPRVIAVGGAPLPVYAKPRPRWLPFEFDWVFGCAYKGLPTKTKPILHLIGTTMAVRRKDLLAIDGIRSNEHGDLEMSHRLLALSPGSVILYVPDAIVRHHVREDRLTWSYFWRRCFFGNRRKVFTLRYIGEAGHLGAERRFAIRALTHGVLSNLGSFIVGDVGGLQRGLAIVIGLGLAGAGYLVGTIEWHVRRRLRRAAHHPELSSRPQKRAEG